MRFFVKLTVHGKMRKLYAHSGKRNKTEKKKTK